MRITGETNDGRIGEKVMDILVTLPYDPEQDTLFFVAVDQHGIIDIEEKYRYSDISSIYREFYRYLVIIVILSIF